MKDGFGSIRRPWNLDKTMKIKTILVISVAALLTACGPGKSQKAASNAPLAAPAPLPTGPEYDSIGVIAALDGQAVTLDHEGASAARLAPGRSAFQAYGDILAEAPLEPGSRVAFKFRKVGDAYELTQLTPR
jgi:hypothetical protein